MYLLIMNKFPFDAAKDQDLARLIVNYKIDWTAPRFKKMGVKAQSLMQKLLTWNPEHRISAIDAVNDEFFAVDSEDIAEIRNSLNIYLKFIKRGPIQIAILKWYVKVFQTNKQRDKYKKIYFHFNQSANGKLTKREMLNSFWEYGMSQVKKKQVDDVFALIDVDGSGNIEYGEFAISVMKIGDILE